MLSIFFIGYFLQVVLAVVVSNSNHDTGKHPGRAHHSQKVKISNSHGYEYSSDYGIELPNFAYDFSELFLNAMITRVADSTDLYLNVMLLGHQTIYEDYPFDAINTDEKYFHAWKKASEHWPLENATTESAHTKHQAKRSQYYCLIHNPVQEFESTPSTKSASHHHIANTYQVHAQWLRINTDASAEDQSTNTATTSSIHRYYDVLRCKIRSSHLIYQHMAELVKRKRRLFVDIIHLSMEKSDYQSSHTSSYAVILSPSTSNHGGNKNASTTPQSIRVYQTTLISFNIPWSQRNMGFPVMNPLFSLMYDQLAVQKVIALGSSTGNAAANAEEKRKNHAVSISNSKFVLFLLSYSCVNNCVFRASIPCHSLCKQYTTIIFHQSVFSTNSRHFQWSAEHSRHSNAIGIYSTFITLRSGSNCLRY
jgi:hypothetical protein